MLEGCVTRGGNGRTRLAIAKFRLYQSTADVDDDFVKAYNAIWKANNALGCRWCGRFSKFGNAGHCRRCYRIKGRLKRITHEVQWSVSNPILNAKAEFEKFVKRLTKSNLNRSARLRALLNWKPERPKT